MKCPNCYTEVRKVNVISLCWQEAIVADSGLVEEYDTPKVMADTLQIECGNCGIDISELFPTEVDRIIVEVSGGVAEYNSPYVEIVDYDNSGSED